MRSLFALTVLLASCDSGPRLVETTRLGNTFDLVGPYVIHATVVGTSAPDAVELELATSAMPTGHAAPMVERQRGLYEGQIPGQPAFTQVRYRVRMRDGDTTQIDPDDSATEPWFGFWVLGAPCAGATDCSVGEYCHVSGTCRAAQGTCRVDADCGTARECGPGGRCRAPTRRCGACALDEACEPISGTCAPRPHCDGGLACPIDFMCEVHAGLCRRVCTDPTVCNSDESCSFGVCRTAP